MALAVQDSLRERGLPALPGRDIRMRIALHCGPAIAGIVGIKSPRCVCVCVCVCVRV